MRSTFIRVAAAVVTLLCSHLAAPAQEVLLSVEGDVAHPLRLAAADFAALPHEMIEIADKEGRRQTYTGVDAAIVLRKAGAPIQADLKSTDAARFLHAQGRDGYVAVFALAEFDRGKFLIVDQIDGAALFTRSGPLQLVAASDDRRTRWVKQVILLQVRASRP